MLDEFGVDIWLFTNEHWLTRNADGEYVPHEKRAIRADPTIVADFSPYLSAACKIVGASADPALLQRCEAAMQQALGAQATAVRSQSYYLDVTPPGCDKGTFVQAMAKRLGISTDAVATIGDMQNDLAMFRKSGMSIAMGNATDDVKQQATHVTASNEDEGFAGAIDENVIDVVVPANARRIRRVLVERSSHTCQRTVPVACRGRRRLLRPLHRRLLARLLGFAEVMRGVDQRDVGQRLREIAGLAPAPESIFLRQQAEIVGDRDHAVEQRLRLVEFARQHMGVGEPQAAGEERALDRLLLLRDLAGIVPQHESVPHHVLLDRRDVSRERADPIGGRKPTAGSSRMLASSNFEP